ncbi:low molecular weight protein arginine phosphatase [Paenibacillus yanchengensis]|uniref:Low molecular weight protein arginine phosphatase n=1 Tax=Paenibacillus yanchengensis TaxID=2035833 RepID=A0ABW4YN21_9BACL
MTNILFVCTGNTCRSPMAEAMFTNIAQQRGLSLSVRSAGVSTMDGMPTSEGALTALKKREITYDGSSKRLTKDAVAWATLILTMTTGHKQSLLQWYPEAVDRTFTLKEFVYQEEDWMKDITELEHLYSEMQMQQALGGQLTGEQRQRLLHLESKIPSFDIADPFGGSQVVYDACALELEEVLIKLADKLA